VDAITDEILHAAEVLRAGGLVAFPTETVYGLGADAADPDALRRLFAVKGRPKDHPVIVHVARAAQLDDLGRDVPEVAHALADACWPGPLTLVVRRRADRVAAEATAGLDTVGIRVPDHPVARRLLEAFGGGVAAPSANRFGRVSPTTAQHVRDDLGVALAADPERSAIDAYDVWKEKSMYGRKYFGVERSTFLIGPDGRIAKIWRKVKVPGHAEEVLAAVKAL